MTDEPKPTTTPTPASPTASNTSSPSSSKSDGHHRFVGWAACLFCSIIALAAKVTDTWDDARNTDDWFVIVVSAISIGCSFFSIMGYAISRRNFPGGVFEGLFAVVCQIAWICGMPIIMDPDRAIAVSKGRSYGIGESSVILEGNPNTGAEFTYIRNANIYFFSWASTIAIVYVCGRFARAAVTRSAKLAAWTGLWYLSTLASLVVMVDGIELYRAFDCIGGNNPDSGLCLATTYAVSLGTVGTFFGFIASILATCGLLGQCLELVGSIVIFCLYMAGVTMITFNDGPGTNVGNLYFATWLGTGVTAVLLGRSYYALIQTWLHKKEKKNTKEEDQKILDEVQRPEEPPVVFPDVEMGDAKAEPDDDDQTPSWVKEDSALASVPPPAKDKEEGVEVKADIPVEKAVKAEEEEEQPPEKEKETTKVAPKKRNSSQKAKPTKPKPTETEAETNDKPAADEEKKKEKPATEERDSTKTQKAGNAAKAKKETTRDK